MGQHLARIAASGVCLFGASALARVGPLYAAVALGIVVVTQRRLSSHDPGGFYSFFYVWIGLYAVFFFSRRVALLYLAAIAAASPACWSPTTRTPRSRGG